ncbi:H/ACA ribonucleoprotein complex subunit 1 [Bombyx mori]|uniref:Uncharacterized protein n=1 Tax=Bombyx mori TaxID=7091 RepID=A0A8R2M3E9_BOMMO|nr:H/ACA ribonucleoprotein complex subunit 1-like [Bombyx mori]
MEYYTKIYIAILVLFYTGVQRIHSAKSEDIDIKETSNPAEIESNPLATLILDRNEMEAVNHRRHTEPLSRVKRQFGYDPYYYNRRNRPLPILIGGGFGIGVGGWGNGRGFGGRGFGGRGFGGRGIGGRGIGGRGFGGRGIGGRGVGGGGRGGRG